MNTQINRETLDQIRDRHQLKYSKGCIAKTAPISMFLAGTFNPKNCNSVEGSILREHFNCMSINYEDIDEGREVITKCDLTGVFGVGTKLSLVDKQWVGVVTIYMQNKSSMVFDISWDKASPTIAYAQLNGRQMDERQFATLLGILATNYEVPLLKEYLDSEFKAVTLSATLEYTTHRGDEY